MDKDETMQHITSILWIRKGFTQILEEQEEPDINPIESIPKEKLKLFKEKANKEMQNSANKDESNLGQLKLEDYDKEPNLPVFVEEVEDNNNEQEKADTELQKYPKGFNDSDDEKEDYDIRPSDNLLVTAVAQENASNLEIKVFEEATSTLFTHHSIFLTSFPFCIEWLPYDPKSQNHQGNYVIVGSKLPEIEIWNMNLINPIEPSFILGGLKNPDDINLSKIFYDYNELKQGSHSGPVLTLKNNPNRIYYLGSGGADKLVKVWDINKCECVISIKNHSREVQTIDWNPVKDSIIASGGIDNKIFIYDLKEGIKPIFSFQEGHEIESIAWYPFNENIISALTERGEMIAYDIRQSKEPIINFLAHEKEATCISYSEGIKGLVATCSNDKTIRVWDIENIEHKRPKLIETYNPSLGVLLSIKFGKDIPWFLACGGESSQVTVWDLESNLNIENAFKGREVNPAKDKENKQVFEPMIDDFITTESKNNQKETKKKKAHRKNKKN